MYRPPLAITEVRTASGKLVRRFAPRGRRALEPNVADLVTYTLQRVIDSGTGTAAAIGRPAAGKTGTAQDYVDAWFCGYVPQLAACVWVGYPRAEEPLLNVHGFPNVYGGSIPAIIWRDFMLRALEGVPVRTFPVPDFSRNTLFPRGTYLLPPSPPDDDEPADDHGPPPAEDRPGRGRGDPGPHRD
ncbi:MAG TPA: penicillin-binding transpeptidase domain-containing protein [Actinomycetota bacterium]|nr:penicillin-binding transpeptidase domain-containing protein [Actinomycetota bacterium]